MVEAGLVEHVVDGAGGERTGARAEAQLVHGPVGALAPDAVEDGGAATRPGDGGADVHVMAPEPAEQPDLVGVGVDVHPRRPLAQGVRVGRDPRVEGTDVEPGPWSGR